MFNDINSYLELPLTELIDVANKIRKEKVGSKIELCNILNAKSGLCNEDCKFCAQSIRYSTDSPVYPLKDASYILESAKYAKHIGAERFGIVTSGNKLSKKEIETIATTVKKIKKEVNIKICASLGKIDRDSLFLLKEAGVTRYHHNIETSEHFYSQIVTTHTFKDRLQTINTVKEVGLEVCSGGIIGLGESWQDRIEMANILKYLDVDSVPINFLIPIKGTPLENRNQLLLSEAIRTICIFRIILQDKIIKIAAGRERVLIDSQLLGFIAGANGMLIGGYLTIKGRSIEEDYKLIEEIKKIWKE